MNYSVEQYKLEKDKLSRISRKASITEAISTIETCIVNNWTNRFWVNYLL